MRRFLKKDLYVKAGGDIHGQAAIACPPPSRRLKERLSDVRVVLSGGSRVPAPALCQLQMSFVLRNGSSAEQGVSMRPSENALVRVHESAQRVSAKRESYRESAKRGSVQRGTAQRESAQRGQFPEYSSDSEENEEETCPRVSYRIPHLKKSGMMMMMMSFICPCRNKMTEPRLSCMLHVSNNAVGRS